MTTSSPAPGSGASPGAGPSWLDRARSLPGRVLRRLQRLTDPWLHPTRRNAARRALAGIGRPRRVLVLCYGNICRSPYAARVLSRAFAERGLAITVLQGGFYGPNRPSTDMARTVAGARGVDLESHVSRLATREDAVGSDLVVVMEAQQSRWVTEAFGGDVAPVLVLGDIDPEPVRERAIIDPYGHGAEVFHEVYSRIERCSAEMARLFSA